jgi:AcrR family transcriptional regulator
VRESILDAVGYLLERYGYKKMTVDDIAHQAGIGKGTVYLYFRSKEEAAFSWFDSTIDEIKAELESIAASDHTPEEKVRLMLTRRVMFAFDHVHRFVQSIDELYAAVRPSLLARRERYHKEQAAIFTKVLREGNTSGSFSLPDVDAIAFALLTATNSLMPYSLSASQLGRREEMEARVKLLADLLLKGMLSRNTASGENIESDK